MRICTTCKCEHPERVARCKSCKSQYAREYYLKHRTCKDRNPPKTDEEKRAIYRAHYLKNRPPLKGRPKMSAEQRRLNSNKFAARYRANNKEKIRAAFRIRKQNDVLFRVRCNLSTRLWKAVTNYGGTKSKATLELLGCNVEFLKGFLEARFTKGMTWKNYGDWHIDHIIPCAEFDLTDTDQQKQCFHYSNLRPLWRFDNQSKNCKSPGSHQAYLI